MLKSKTSTILAATALVVAVFGSTPLGHAAVSIVLPKGSVGTYQLKRGAVTSLKVKNYSLVAADFKAGQLPTGPQGPKGDTGAPGVSGYQIVEENSYLLVGQTGTVTATCPVGKKAMGGGVGSDAKLAIIESMPTDGGQGWKMSVSNLNADSGYSVFAVCAIAS